MCRGLLLKVRISEAAKLGRISLLDTPFRDSLGGRGELVTRLLLLCQADAVQVPAITSISTSASLGRRDTCTVERAGGAAAKYLPYTSFMAAKSFMSFRKTVVFTT